ELIRDGLKQLRSELSLWKEEVREKFEDDPILVRGGDMDKMWILNTEESLKQWVPKDGTVKRAGYCNLKTIRPRKSFQREIYLDWSLYNHLELRVRGDGRSYLINISTAGYFDITWNDIYSYVLYTERTSLAGHQ
ncbi:Complex I intermediate-associated protein 30-like 1, partial [Homarus americanus]